MLRSFFIFVKRSYSDAHSILKILKKGKLDQQVSVQGWIKSVRKQKEITFLDINDGSTPKSLQVVLTEMNDINVNVGASVSATGVLRQTPKGQNELSTTSIKVIGACELAKGYPFAPRKQYEPDYVREYLHFRPKTRTFSSLLRVRASAYLAIHNYLNQNGYFNIHTPIITANDCEGAGEIFKVVPENEKLSKSKVKENISSNNEYFNTPAYLTVSGQLHLEAAAHALSKVYCFGPTFRAENSKSRFHLSEFYMLEIEQAFLDNLDILLDVVEKLLKHVTADLIEKNLPDFQACTQKQIDYTWTDKRFIRVSYEEAREILSKKLNQRFSSKAGLSKEHEMALTQYFGNVPVFVVNWPKSEKPFYMKQIDNDQVAAFDLLAPNVGEIVGGSLREDNYEKLKARVPQSNCQLNWYLDLRQFGSVPTGGFGMGFERYLQLILGIDNIKDCIPFPRWPHNCKL